MKTPHRIILAALLLAGISPALGQQFPTVPGQSLIGRLGIPGDTGPSQAIPMTSVQAALNASVNTIAALRNLHVGASNQANVLGYYAPGDGGGGAFIWNSSSTATDNNGSIIAVTGVTTGRWIRQTSIPNQFTPEMFGAKGDGVTSTYDANAIDDLMSYLTSVVGSGTMQLSCGKTYLLVEPTGTGPFGARGNSQALVRLFSNVNVHGCGRGSVIKMANNVNTSSSRFVYGLTNTNTLNNVDLADFDVDMNGANNSCSQTCYHNNAAIQANAGDSITLRNIMFKNNPGSNDTVFGSNVEPPTVTNLSLVGLIHEHSGDAVNAASLDWSGDFFIATNVTYSNIRHSDGPRVNGSAFELHGTNITASNIVVNDHFNCGIVATEPSGAASITKVVNVTNVTCNNVKGGLQVAAKSGATDSNLNLSHLTFNYLAGAAGPGLDACSVMDPASTGNINLLIDGVIYNSAVTTNLGNGTYAVSACYWTNVIVRGVQSTNTQGGAVKIDNVVAGGSYIVMNVQATTPGRTSTAADQVALRFINTSAATAGNITMVNVTSTGSVQYNISGNVSATQSSIDPGSLAANPVLGHWNWTGTGMANVIFPQAQTNFRGTGGTGQFIKQTAAGGAFSVSAPIFSEIGGGGTGVAAALAINPGTAGSVVLNGGALGSPSSAGTMPAHTLGGAISGGGNQINNVIIGAATPLAGTFTTAGITSSLNINAKVAWSATAPAIAGGFCTSPGVLSANGTAAFVFTVGASGCAVSTGTLLMPTASNGWRCDFANVTSPNGNKPDETSSTTTTVAMTNYSRTTGTATNWTNGDNIVGACTAY